MKTLVINTLIHGLKILLVLLDICINRLFNGRVETISSRAGRGVKSRKLWAVVLCRLLDRIKPGHCERATQNPKGGL